MPRSLLARSRLFLLFGVAAFACTSVYALGGFARLFEYSAIEHTFTARAMMRGTLALHANLDHIGHDEQIYDGAGFTNWSFGVPLLEIPFHLVTRALGGASGVSFAPNRLVFLVYLTGLFPLLALAIHRVTFARGTPGETAATSWLFSGAATLAIVAYTIYPLTSYRFLTYEETVAYLALAELYALACYLRFVETGAARWVVGVAIAAGLGLVIRGTGSLYLLMWGLAIATHARASLRRNATAYVAAAAPLVAFWLFANWVRAGSPLSLGYVNAMPDPSQFTMVRFGSQCANTLPRFLTMAATLFQSLFIVQPGVTPLEERCHCRFETRLPGDAPFFPALVPFVLCASLALYVVKRETRLASYLPHLTFAALFFTLAFAGVGFSSRYTGDFWPLVAMIGAQLAPRAHLGERPLPRHALTFALLLGAGVVLVRDVAPALRVGLSTTDMLHTMTPTQLARDVPEEGEGEVLRTLTSRVACDGPRPPVAPPNAIGWGSPRNNGVGWLGGCEVLWFTHLYLRVPPRPDAHYTLRIWTGGAPPPTFPVYVNGRVYAARRGVDAYEVALDLDARRLFTPVVMVTIEWTPEPVPPPVKLMAMEID